MADITISEEALTERINRAVSDAVSAEALKYKDYPDLQAKATKLAELQQAQESDAEKRIREAKEAAEGTVTTRVSEATGAMRQALVNEAIRAQAAINGFRYPDDVVNALASNAKIKVGADHKVTGVDEAVKQLAKDRPEWVGAAQQTFNGAPPRGAGPHQVVVPGNYDEATARAMYVASQVDQQRARLGITGTSI